MFEYSEHDDILAWVYEIQVDRGKGSESGREGERGGERDERERVACYLLGIETQERRLGNRRQGRDAVQNIGTYIEQPQLPRYSSSPSHV